MGLRLERREAGRESAKSESKGFCSRKGSLVMVVGLAVILAGPSTVDSRNSDSGRAGCSPPALSVSKV